MFNKSTSVKEVVVKQEVVDGLTIQVQARVRNGVVHCQVPNADGGYDKFDLPAYFVPAFAEVIGSVGANAKSLANTGTNYLTVELSLKAIPAIAATIAEDDGDEFAEDSDEDDDSATPLGWFSAKW